MVPLYAAQLLHGQDVHRIAGVSDDGDAVYGHPELDGVNAIGLGGLDLAGLYLPRGLCNVHLPVDQGGDAGAASAPGDLDHDIGVLSHVFLCPDLAELKHRIGPLLRNDAALTVVIIIALEEEHTDSGHYDYGYDADDQVLHLILHSFTFDM